MKLASLLSEEDVRTKIVSAWLLDHGFGYEDIYFEYAFSIRLGRQRFMVESGKISRIPDGTKTIRRERTCLRPRSDILVRNADGKNLLIIEVKAPDEKINEQSRDQGISYARLLDDIPPFVIVTNGRETKIFDSITKKCIDGQSIPSNHPYVIAGFSVGLPDLCLRSEALEKLITLSEENLISFCTAQCLSHMKRLRSDDLDCGKRYIPSLYVERIRAKESIISLLDAKKDQIILLTGPPQVGKTNFICNLVEELLGKGVPCLFYSAVDVLDGLFIEIGLDFEWIMGDSQRSAKNIHDRLKSILGSSDKTLILFIDGLNEAAPESVRRIDYELQHLLCNEIQIIISTADYSISRLLRDQTGNPTWIADSVGLINAEIDAIASGCEKRNQPIIHLASFDPQEFIHAYEKYSAAYSVTVPECHQMVSDPFLIGLAFRLHRNRILPENLDGPELISEWIKEKIGRSGLNEYIDVKSFLTELADEMLRHRCLVPESVAGRLWGLPGIRRLPARLFESSLISLLPGHPNWVDFSTDNERSFVIAYWARSWPQKIDSFQEIDSEFANAVNTSFGTEAVRWFLKQSRHIDQIGELEKFPIFGTAKANELWLNSLALTDKVSREPEFIDYITMFFFDDPDYDVKAAAGWVIEKLMRKKDMLISRFSQKEFVEAFIDVVINTNTAPSLNERIGTRMTNLLSALERHLRVSDYTASCFWEHLTALITHLNERVREAAAIIISDIDPYYFLKTFAGLLKEIRSRNISFTPFLPAVDDACGQILSHLEDCSDFADDDICEEELQNLSREYSSILETLRYVYRDSQYANHLHKLWITLPPLTRNWYE